MAYTSPNKSGKPTANDSVMTFPHIAEAIINHYWPVGKLLEPCKGDGSFYDIMKEPKDWCEISEGKDFLSYNKKVDWIITNPPFSIYDLFLLKSFEIADNIVFLAPLQKVFKSKKMDNHITDYGGIPEILMLGSGTTLGFPFGFPCGCIYFKRGYTGTTSILRKYQWSNKASTRQGQVAAEFEGFE